MAEPEPLAIALGGGGARAAYQVGALRALGRHFPDLALPILSGVSAGAINSSFLASSAGDLAARTESLADLWLRIDQGLVFEMRSRHLARDALCFGWDVMRGRPFSSGVRGLVDTAPLRETLSRAFGVREEPFGGIDRNLDAGRLRALALTTTCYDTGQTITFVHGREIEDWERPNRKSLRVKIGVDHVMASSALPFFFPSVQIGERFYGDGGIRLVAPFAPVIHLGATRILTISTRYSRSREEAEQSSSQGPPTLAQILGVLYNAIFLDMLEQDALTMDRMNALLRELPARKRGTFRPVRLLMLRPSRDLGLLAGTFEPRLPGMFRFLTRRLGTGRARGQDWLSTVMFQRDYIREIYEMGMRDTERRLDEVKAFLDA